MSFFKFLVCSIKMFYRNWQALFFSLFLPVMFMVIFGLADFGKFADIKIGIIDQAQTDQSKELITNLGEIDILQVQTGNENDLKEMVKKGDIDLALIIPQDMIKSKMVPIELPGIKLPPNIQLPQKPEFEKTELTVYINDGKKAQAQNALTVLKEVFNKLNYQITGTTEIFNFNQVSVSQKAANYLDFLIPGIVALSIMQMSLMSIIFTIVAYREKGVLKRLQITPIKSYIFTTTQVLTRLIISIIQVSILIAIAVLVFKIHIAGSYALVLLLTLLGSVVFIAMGLTLSAIAKTEDTAAPLANIVMMPMMFLGNVFFPINTMPDWLQHIVKYLPLNYLSDALREVMVNGATATNISHDIYGLSIWAIAIIIIASITFRWKTID